MSSLQYTNRFSLTDYSFTNFKVTEKKTKWLTWILLKYWPASNGMTLYVDIPVIATSVGFFAV